MNDAHQFLRTLFAPYATDSRFTCEIRCFEQEEVAQYWFSLLPAYLDLAASRAELNGTREDVYAGVLPRLLRRGNAESVPAAAWLWLEIDLGDDPPQAAHDLVRKAKLPCPRMFVSSGSGGGHFYFPLDRPFALDSREARTRFDTLLRRLVEHVGGEPGKAHADPACVDVSRILRIPGTLNHKHSPPRPVVLKEFMSAVPRSVDWWESYLPFASPRSRGLYAKAAGPIREQAPAGFVSNGWIPPRIQEWARTPAPHGTRHRDMAGMATFCFATVRLPYETVRDLMYQKAQISPGPPLTVKEVENLIMSAWKKFA